MAAARLTPSNGPALAVAYGAGFADGYRAGYRAARCTGNPVSRAVALKRVAAMHRGWLVSCRTCNAWHVCNAENEQHDLVREKYRRSRAVPETYGE